MRRKALCRLRHKADKASPMTRYPSAPRKITPSARPTLRREAFDGRGGEDGVGGFCMSQRAVDGFSVSHSIGTSKVDA